MVSSVPVIDIFAGPGGLSEGFSAFSRTALGQPFRIKLSIEKDSIAHRTLLLRAFFRQFQFRRKSVPGAYYDFLRNTSDTLDDKFERLFKDYPVERLCAESEARQAELGVADSEIISQWIDASLDGAENWVLLGGPPCQAYSLAGRSRNKGIDDYVPEEDELQYLYVEYLKIIADHLPAVFIMENVKGLLSATLYDQYIFERICEDLQNPAAALRREGRRLRRGRRQHRGRAFRYRLFSLVAHAGNGQSYSLFPLTNDEEQELKLANSSCGWRDTAFHRLGIASSFWEYAKTLAMSCRSMNN